MEPGKSDMGTLQTRRTLCWGWAAGGIGAILGGLALAWVQSETMRADEGGDTKKPIFGPSQVWRVDLRLSAEELAAMQPAPVGPFGAPPGPAGPRSTASRPTERNLFGVEFPWAKAEVTINGEAPRHAGLRYSGEITYFSSSMSLKRPLRIGFDRFGGEKWQGHSGLQLQAMPLDPSKARQVVAGEIFRGIGVPAPQSGR